MDLDDVEDLYPLSPTQAGMVYHTLAQPDTGMYIGVASFLISGELDAEALTASWEQLLERHAILRSSILWDELDQPLQVVHREVPLPWDMLDWQGKPESEQARDFTAFKAAELARDFDLALPPLMRLTLIRLSVDRHWLVWTSHHALADGWSVDVLAREMRDIYASVKAGRGSELPPAFPYKRFIAWLQSRDLGPAESYWRSRLAGFTEPTLLQISRPPGHGMAGRTPQYLAATLDSALSQSLRDAAKSCQVSLSTLLQCAWGVLLHRYSGQDDVVFGVTSSGRPPALSGVESAVGLFITTLPVRQRFSAGVSVRDWLKQLQSDALEFMRYEFTPLARVKEWSDVPPGIALFDSILVVSNYRGRQAGEEEPGDWHIADMDVIDYSNYGLALVVAPDERISLKLEFDTRLYEAALAERLLDEVALILRTLAEQPGLPVTDIPIHSTEGRASLLRDCCEGEPFAAPEGSVVDEILARAASRPDADAVSCGADTLSYGELDMRSSRLAQTLTDSGLGRGSRIAVCLERGVAVIEALLAVLRIGAVYIPLDPAYPSRRIAYVLENAGCDLVISSAALTASLVHVNCPVFPIDGGTEPVLEPLRPAERDDRDYAYVIYTSGSTGKPKGVAVTHANLAYSTHARRAFYPEPPRSFLLLSSFAFDSSMAGIFWTLTTGGRLVIAESRLEQDMVRLSELISAQGVTHTLCLPSLYQVILDDGVLADLGSLRAVILAGEAVPAQIAKGHRAKLPQARLYNEYGPTEATVWCSVLDATDWQGEGGVPIGRPIPGAAIYLLDSRQRLVPMGAVGEIYVSGPGVAGAYLDDADATDEKFMEDPFAVGATRRMYRTGDLGRYLPSGEIEFLGRVDEQAKIRGYRIEIAEIEAALLEHEGIAQAAALIVDEAGAAATGSLSEGELAQLESLLLAMDPADRESLLGDVESLPEGEDADAIESTYLRQNAGRRVQ